MRIKFLASAIGTAVLLALGVAASGCGGGDDTSSSAEPESSEAAETAATDTTAPPGAATVTVKMPGGEVSTLRFISEAGKWKQQMGPAYDSLVVAENESA